VTDKTQPVCVTGAAGFIGSHVVRELLEGGYRVRATVRDAGDVEKTRHLHDLAAGRKAALELVSADLQQRGSFDAAVDGCQYVFHLASPVTLTAADPQRDIVDPAVDGTRNLLEAVIKSGTVKAVGLASSIAAVVGGARGRDHVYTENDWNDGATVTSNPYGLSKTLAERTAWDMQRELTPERRFRLFVVNPVVVLGPVYTLGHRRSSVSVVRDLLSGRIPACPPLSFGLVDVRDVATALVAGVERGAPDGRYILHSDSLWMRELAHIIRAHFPQYRVPTLPLPGPLTYLGALVDRRLSLSYLRRNLNRRDHISAAKVERELGLRMRPVTESVIDTCRSLIALGLVRPSAIRGARPAASAHL
jgi:dihydroflavonol-4-reductase